MAKGDIPELVMMILLAVAIFVISLAVTGHLNLLNMEAWAPVGKSSATFNIFG